MQTDRFRVPFGLGVAVALLTACGGGGGGTGGGSNPVPTPVPQTWNSVTLKLSNAHPQMGASSQVTVTVTAYNSTNGKLPAGTTFATPIALYDSDTSGATKLSTTSVTTQGQSVTLQYDGKSYINAIISAGQPASPSGGAQEDVLEPTLRATEYPIPSGKLAATNAGNGRIFSNADGSLTFLENQAIGHVTLAGQITETNLPRYEYDIDEGPDAHVWIVAQNGLNNGTTEIARLNDDGSLTEYPMTDWVEGPLITGPDGNFWIASSLGSAQAIARRMTPTGAVVNYPIPSGETGMKFGVSGPDGNIWFAGNASGYNNFVKVTTSGSATVYPLPSNALPCCEPQMDNLIVGPDSQLYTFLDEQQLGRITTADVFSEFAAWVIGLPWNQQYTPMGNGPDGAIWFTMGFTGDCHPQVGRATTSGVFAIFWLPVCAPIPGTIEPAPNAFVTGADKNLWYTRDAYVGKITI